MIDDKIRSIHMFTSFGNCSLRALMALAVGVRPFSRISVIKLSLVKFMFGNLWSSIH